MIKKEKKHPSITYQAKSEVIVKDVRLVQVYTLRVRSPLDKHFILGFIEDA